MKIYKIYLTEKDFLIDNMSSYAQDLTQEEIEKHNNLGHVITKTTIQVVENSKRFKDRNKIKK